MVVFMVKWAVAAIPALLILMIIGALFSTFVVGLLFSAAIGSRSFLGSKVQTPTAPAATSESKPDNPPPETLVYLSRVSLVGIRVGDSLTGKGVFGEVKNNGDRALSKIEVTIYCLGRDKKPVFEKTYTPVLVGPFSFGDEAQPLKPGYSRKFGVRLDDAPSDWGGEVDVKVTAVTFADSKGGA
jgi:hypothetical protein